MAGAGMLIPHICNETLNIPAEYTNNASKTMD